MTVHQTGATRILAEHIVATKLDDIPVSARERIALHAMDTAGVGLAASGEHPGRIVTGLFPEGGAGSVILGTAKRAAPWDAAWANGSLCHLLDFDDIDNHPSVCILPAVLAVGEKLGSSGRDMVLAMAVGYEAFSRIIGSFHDYEPRIKITGIHPMCICGGTGAAAAVGKLLGLSVEQMRVALGIAASQSFGLIEQFGSWAKGLQAGNIARAGVMGGLLAQQDYYGSRTALEGSQGLLKATVGDGNFDIGVICAGWGETWWIEDPGVPLKPLPVCGGAQRPSSTAIEIRRDRLASADDVERVEVSVTEGLLKTLRVDWPERGYDGKFCLRFVVAAGLLDGDIRIETFSDEYLARPQVQAMLKRIDVKVRKGGYDDQVERKRTPVRVFLKDGTVIEHEVHDPRGSVANPMNAEEVRAKFSACAGRVLSAERTARALDLLQNLEATGARELAGALAARG
jgi:2-methylcitrate dehydratase PrpD